MKALIPSRAVKAIDQQAQSGAYPYGATYIPLENHQTWTGYGVSPELAMNMVTVYQCVRVLSNLFAQLPFILYRRLPNGGKERAIDHPWYRTLHLQANPDMSSFAWRRLLKVHVATWGNHFSEVVYDQLGRPQLWPIRPGRMDVYYEDGRKVFDYISPTGGRKRMKPGSVFHVTGLSQDGLLGSSPVNDLRSTITLARTTERFGENFFRNGARPATVLTHPKTLSDPAVARLTGQMEDLRGAGNAGKTVLLEEGMDFKEIGVPPEDAQFLQTRLFQKRELAGAYGIPPHKIGDLERATFSNIEHQALEFIQDTMMPHFVNTEMEASIQLIQDDDYFAEFLVDGYLRGDAETRAKAFAIRWQHGTLNADEWRAAENQNPIEGGSGQLFYAPVNYAPVNAPESPEAEPPSEDMAVPPPFTVVKSAAVRCAKGHLLAEIATPPYRFTCGKCKTVTEETGEPAARKHETIYDYDADGRVKRTVELAS